MPAEVDTGGHRVLHCDSRAVCPTATPIHVSTITDDRSWIIEPDRASFPKQSRFDGSNVAAESNRRIRKDRRRRHEFCAGRAEPLDRRNARNSLLVDLDSTWLTRVPRIDGGEQEEPIPDASGTEYSATRNYPSAQPLHRGRREGALTCLVYRGSSRTIEDDVFLGGRPSVTWNWRRCANDESERAESRLRDYEAAGTSESLNARRRSHQSRLCARSPSRPSRCRWQETDRPRVVGHDPRGTRTSPTTEGSVLLSSQHLRARSDEESREDINERIAVNADARTADENARSDCSRRQRGRRRRRRRGRRRRQRQQQQRRRDGGSEEVPIGRQIEQDSPGGRIKRGCRVRSFLRLAFLLFLVAFGRCGLLGSPSAFKFSARPIASGLSVLGIGAIVVGAVSAAPSDLMLLGDAGTRAERSANLSHITGASRKIQMYIKNRHLQILPDGTVNGSNDDTSDYSEYHYA